MAQVAANLGQPFMPWQRYVADVALEVNPKTGLLVYRKVGLLVPRQSGKTTELLAVMVHRALAFGAKQRQRISYTAQTRNDARKKWEDEHLHILDHSPYGGLYETRKANGSEAILWQNGSIHDLIATTQQSGHGPTLDLGVCDEAFAQVDFRLEQAMSPAMITRPEPQMWVVSTAGTPASVLLWSTVEAGRQRCDMGLTESVAYFEWSAPEEADPGDPATWWGCMPALGHTVTEAAVAGEYASLQLAEFRRAYLNQWTTSKADPVISAEAWESCLDEKSKIRDPVALAVDVTPDHAWASIAACGSGPTTQTVHVETVEHRIGTEWVTPRLGELCRRWKPLGVMLDPTGPAGALVPKLAAAGIEVTLVNGREHAQACGALFEAVSGKRLRHIGQPDLSAAVDGATKRPLGDAWAWSRTNSSVDISPLVAVTLALWGYNTKPRQTDPQFHELDDYIDED